MSSGCDSFLSEDRMANVLTLHDGSNSSGCSWRPDLKVTVYQSLQILETGLKLTHAHTLKIDIHLLSLSVSSIPHLPSCVKWLSVFLRYIFRGIYAFKWHIRGIRQQSQPHVSRIFHPTAKLLYKIIHIRHIIHVK